MTDGISDAKKVLRAILAIHNQNQPWPQKQQFFL